MAVGGNLTYVESSWMMVVVVLVVAATKVFLEW
jgi:hypothetical protein